MFDEALLHAGEDVGVHGGELAGQPGEGLTDVVGGAEGTGRL